MKLPTFELDGKTYRFARITRRIRDPYDYIDGYPSWSEGCYNIVQQKRWWGWKTVEEEHIPMFALIALGALGSTDWESEMIARWKRKLK
jgi:hypothetical protein